MPVKREHYIGARFTEKEKEYILNFTKKRNITLSELVRESVFSHINFIGSHENNLRRVEKVEYMITHKSDHSTHKTKI